MNKKRELELQTEQLQQQVNQLQMQIAQMQQNASVLNGQIDGYRAQEKAVVQALTDAQASAAKRIGDAEEQAGLIREEAEAVKAGAVSEAEAVRVAAQAEAEAVTNEAAERAAGIVESAQAESARRLAQTEASVADFEARLNALNAALLETSRQAREQAEAFARAMESFAEGTPEILTEGRDLASLVRAQEGMPDSYETPQELMRSIYQLRGRRPVAEEKEDEEPAAGESVPEAEQEPEPEPAPAEEPAAAESAAAAPSEEPEERIWTVEEVMAKNAQWKAAELSADTDEADLDSLLDEIIKD